MSCVLIYNFSYFPLVGNMVSACHAVASYLLFYPDDEAMLSNKKYYSKQPKAREEYFYPREVSQWDIQ